MSLDLHEREFIEKYGFAIGDLYLFCIKDICRRSYWCGDPKDIAFQIESEIYKALNEDNINTNILYKQTKDMAFNIEIYIHNIAIPYKDIYFTFEIKWTGNSLSVEDWDLKSKEEIENDKKYEDIEDVLTDEEENVQ